jgi:hypothetical protein
MPLGTDIRSIYMYLFNKLPWMHGATPQSGANFGEFLSLLKKSAPSRK